MTNLLLAIAIVESSGNPLAIGDDGLSWGLYQIRPAYVRDVNRILGAEEYTHRDAFNAQYAKRMVEVYLNHYATPERIGRPVTDEDRARIHNGGPNGWRKESTNDYWRKVRSSMPTFPNPHPRECGL